MLGRVAFFSYITKKFYYIIFDTQYKSYIKEQVIYLAPINWHNHSSGNNGYLSFKNTQSGIKFGDYFFLEMYKQTKIRTVGSYGYVC